MKKLNFIIFFVCFVLFVFGQNRAYPPKHLKDLTVKNMFPNEWKTEFEKPQNAYVKSSAFVPEEYQIGETIYDNQSNASMQNTIYLYEDQTIGAIWNIGMNSGNMFDDKGAGYNYFDGTSWDEWPTTRIENVRCGRPSYSSFGPNGEIIVSHTSGQGLIISTRDEKGVGDWSFSNFSGPAGQSYILWNRTITSGVDRNRVHTLSLTLPSTHGGTPYMGLDGALLYSMSLDGGNTWQMENEILDEMTQNEYSRFEGDTYVFAEPKDDIVAFVVGDSWYDLFLMKSTDGGETFEKTIIWEHPYPFWVFGMPADTFYCADGSHTVAIDNDGIVHVAFGITKAYADGEGSYWYPFVDGIGYWNENMPEFSNDPHALDPYGHPDSELIENYNLIGWSQDMDNNGTLEFLNEIGYYYIGLSSMPQLVIDNQDQIFLVYSSVTEGYHNMIKNYRHLWARKSQNGSNIWDDFYHLTSDLSHSYDECVFPSCAANSDGYIYLVCQLDDEPGTAIWGQQHPYLNNRIMFMNILKEDFIGIEIAEENILVNNVSQNYPNPFSEKCVVNVNLKKASFLSLEITNIQGQVVAQQDAGYAQAGIKEFFVYASLLKPGMYFYTVKANENSVTKKMVVE